MWRTADKGFELQREPEIRRVGAQGFAEESGRRDS
jgi:hypothetical protein